MSRYRLGVIFLSFALFAGCGTGNTGSDAGGDGGVSGGGGGPNPTTTTNFDFNDFTGVVVAGPFSASIVSGPFSTQVTVDSDVVELLDVREEGQLLIVGFEPGNDIDSQTLEVTISMPTLASINLAGLAFGTISGFDGSVLDIHLAGIATLEGQNVSYDFLMADVAGISSLFMEDASPLPAADLHVAGVSSAVVNMMDSAALTGTAVGISSLSYYGSDVIIDVTTDKTSSVNRLGDSRP